jgi:hypothetical protein
MLPEFLEYPRGPQRPTFQTRWEHPSSTLADSTTPTTALHWDIRKIFSP